MPAPHAAPALRAGNASKLIAAVVLLALAGCKQPPPASAAAAYADPKTCATCHAEIAATYAKTGMARSFYQPTAANTVEDYTRNNRYYHAASQTWFQMSRRGSNFFQRRWQLGPGSREVNVEELQINYIMGSGNHVRSYLHRSASGTLIELPLAWYPEHGGGWAMNPGYESPHIETRRKIAYECMFCHNGYPQVAARSEAPVYPAELPEGIDCQRCHGPGAAHAAAPARGNILNPARLSPDRQMEVCMQCHLQTQAEALPSELRRFNREPFSYNPAEPLTDFKVFFDRDRPPHSPPTAGVEIVSSAYRLRQSQCYLKSAGKLVCETCHNPHDIPRAQAASDHYDGVCKTCHAASHPQTAQFTNCAGCHMPKRQTTDVIHSQITDHLIQRRPLPPSPPAQAYQGEVVPYYPKDPGALLEAAAQVVNNTNLASGIPRLEAELAKSPAGPEAYIILGDAERHNHNPAQAAIAYQKASEQLPTSSRALRSWAVAAKQSGQPAVATDLLKRAVQQFPADPENWYELGLLDSEQSRPQQAIEELRKSLSLDPDSAAAYSTLAGDLIAINQFDQAEEALRASLQIDPYEAATHSNLARLQAAKGQMRESLEEFATAAKLDPTNARNHFFYGMALASLGQTGAARDEWKRATAGNDPAAAKDATAALAQIK